MDAATDKPLSFYRPHEYLDEFNLTLCLPNCVLPLIIKNSSLISFKDKGMKVSTVTKRSKRSKVSSMQSRARDSRERISSKLRVDATKAQSRLLKNHAYYSNMKKNLWDHQPFFCKKQLKLYHNRVKRIEEETKLREDIKKEREEKKQKTEERVRLKTMKWEARERRDKRVLERLALQKMSSQFIGDQDSSVRRKVRMMNSRTAMGLARAKSVRQSMKFLKKSGCDWNDYRGKVQKYLDMELTSKVLDGEDLAVHMINERIDDYLESKQVDQKYREYIKSEIIKLRNSSKSSLLSQKYRKKSKDKLKGKKKRYPVSNRKVTRSGSMPIHDDGRSFKLYDFSAKTHKNLFKRPRTAQIRSSEHSKYHSSNLENEISTKVITDKDRARRIDYCEEFRNLEIRDAGARSNLVRSNLYIQKLRNSTDLAKLTDQKKLKNKGRKALGIGIKRCQSAKLTGGGLKNKGKKVLWKKQKRPFDKEFMSLEAQKQSHVKPFVKDRIENYDNVKEMDQKNVRAFFLFF